jgi:outer membrane receptor protein involved in Fe transport
LNGAPLPSSEADRKAFAFDVFPANMLDNLIINKTATADMPAEFAGGSININTKDIVSKNFSSVSVGVGYNTITTFKKTRTYDGGATDFFGIDDGTRALPSFIPNTKDFPNPASLNPNLAKTWNNKWGTYLTTAIPNLNFQYVEGRNKPKNGKDYFGSLFAVSFNRSNTISQGLNKDHVELGNGDTTVPASFFNLNNYIENVMMGALANFSLKLTNRSTISLKNAASINSDDRVIERIGYTGLSESEPVYSIGRTLAYTSNKFLSSQLLGDHFISKPKIKLNWLAAYSGVNRSMPDMRTTIYTSTPSIPELRASISSNATTNGNGGGIYYSSLKENSVCIKSDASKTFNVNKRVSTIIKTGVFLQSRTRNYGQRNLGMVKGDVGNIPFNFRLLYLNEDEIFASKNIGKGGFILAEDKNATNNYDASTTLTSAYAMFDSRLYESFRLIGGMRVENYYQKLILPTSQDINIDVTSTVLDWLPSASLVYSLNKKQNIRLGYAKTLNRPEFRELAPAKFFDFATRYVTNGDTTLRRAAIQNYDLRYEWYPGNAQVFTFSFFYKKFTDPIEQATAPDKEREAAYFNVPSATNQGVEIEGRALLSSLFGNKGILNKLTLFTNASFVKSVVDAKKAGDTSTQIISRPLQGQSPYCFNAGLTYQDDKTGLSATLAANRVGQRIFIVGNITEPNIWENARTVIDLQFAKTIAEKNIELKLNIKDILTQDQLFFEDINQDNKYSKGDYVRWSRNFGRVISFSVAYKF